MKKRGIFWGLTLIIIAVLLIIDALSANLWSIGDIPVLKIIFGVFCLAWLGTEIYKLKISHFFFPLAFIFLLFESEIASIFSLPSKNIISNWTVILIALFFTIGTALIFPNKKKCNSEESYLHIDCKNTGHKIMGNTTKYFDASDFEKASVSNHMGKTEVFFDNIEDYNGRGTLYVENHMGSTVIHIPSSWHIIENITIHMGNVKVAQSSDEKAPGKTIIITGECHMGVIEIDYI